MAELESNREFYELENWANRKLMMSNKEKSQLLLLGQYKQTHDWRMSSNPAEKKNSDGL